MKTAERRQFPPGRLVRRLMGIMVFAGGLSLTVSDVLTKLPGQLLA